jgi:hypothetical protein
LIVKECVRPDLDDSFAVLGRFAVPVKFLSTLSPMGGEVAIVDGEKL